MSSYIIDTHIFLWLIFDPSKIDNAKMKILKNQRNRIFIASISFWEISLKYNLGKLELNGIEPDELPSIAKKMGIEVLEVDKNTMASFYKLPQVPNHKDPFDRIIIWKCINDDMVLISQDRKVPNYKRHGLKTVCI